MVDLLDFLDAVDELCDELPDWLPERAERIQSIKDKALKLCRECLKFQQ